MKPSPYLIPVAILVLGFFFHITSAGLFAAICYVNAAVALVCCLGWSLYRRVFPGV